MKADRQAPIGVFDSGVGGLTVVREIMRNLPDERIVYFGDTARVPYGSKSKNTVIRLFPPDRTLSGNPAGKAIVIACNTASALALDTIEKEIDLPIIGVVKPGAQMAVETTQTSASASSQPRALFRAASTSSSLPRQIRRSPFTENRVRCLCRSWKRAGQKIRSPRKWRAAIWQRFWIKTSTR